MKICCDMMRAHEQCGLIDWRNLFDNTSVPVLASKRDVVCASRALCPHHCWSPQTLAPHFSHMRISLGTPGQRSALVAYDSSLRIIIVGTASNHSHHLWSLVGFSRGRSIPSTPAAVLASSAALSSSSVLYTNLRRSSKPSRN